MDTFGDLVEFCELIFLCVTPNLCGLRVEKIILQQLSMIFNTETRSNRGAQRSRVSMNYDFLCLPQSIRLPRIIFSTNPSVASVNPKPGPKLISHLGLR